MRLRNDLGVSVGRGAPSNILKISNRLNVHTLRFLTPLRYTHRPEMSPDVNLWAIASSADLPPKRNVIIVVQIIIVT